MNSVSFVCLESISLSFLKDKRKELGIEFCNDSFCPTLFLHLKNTTPLSSGLQKIYFYFYSSLCNVIFWGGRLQVFLFVL